MAHRHEIRVRYGETDKMGVVHHSVYPLYFEEARTELMRATGVRYADLEADGYLLPLIDLGIRFLRGPRYDDVLVIEVRLVEATRVRLRLEYRVVRKGDDEVLALGETHHACTNPDLFPRRLPVPIFERLAGTVEPGFGEDPGPAARQS
jgi:acyl-CoA thioester hydrolase